MFPEESKSESIAPAKFQLDWVKTVRDMSTQKTFFIYGQKESEASGRGSDNVKDKIWSGGTVRSAY